MTECHSCGREERRLLIHLGTSSFSGIYRCLDGTASKHLYIPENEDVLKLVDALFPSIRLQLLSLCLRVATDTLICSNNAFTTVPSVNTATRLADLLLCLDELQVQLSRTGLGALPVTGEGVDYTNIQAMIANMAQEVQGKCKHRQRIREGAGVAKSVFK